MKNESQLQIYFKVKKGKLVVDRSKSKFISSETFKSRLTNSQRKAEIDLDKVVKVLFGDLDNVLAKSKQLYWYAFSNDQQRSDDSNGKLTDRLTKRVRTYTGDWSGFKDLFTKWVNDGHNRNQLGPLFSSFFNSPTSEFTANLNNSALIFFPEKDEGGTNYDADSGTATFQVADPVGGWSNKQDYKICFPLDINDHCTAGETDPKANDIRGVLSKLPNTLWRPAAIRVRIEDYYAGKGFLPAVTLSAADEDPKWINIQISPRIGQILLPGTDVDDNKVDKILYLLLPDREFRFFIRCPRGPIREKELRIPSDNPGQSGQTIKFKYIDYLELGENKKSGDEPFLNQSQLQVQQLQLAQLGFAVTQIPSSEAADRGGKSFIDLNVLKMAKSGSASGEKPDNAPKQSAPVANKQGVVDPRPQKPQFQTEPVPAASFVPSKPKALLNQPGPEQKKNYIGGGIEYFPSQGVRPLFFYQRSGLGPGDLSLQAGEMGGKALGSINYFTDFVLFGDNLLRSKFYRRMTLQFSGFSDFESNRLFYRTTTDERRTGGLARAELELFRDLDGHLLRLSLEGGYNKVELKQSNLATSKQDLTTLDLRSFYLFEGVFSRYPISVRLEPRIRIGLGLAAEEPSFVTFGLNANFHQKLPQLFEIDISGRIEQDSTNTPLFEQASFGGADVVRGFRRDDAIGRRLWSLQNELWVPVPGTSNSAEGLGLFLRRNVRLVGFVDVGGVYQTTGSKPGVRVGPGLGVRVIYNQVVLKFDWAYGLGDAAAGTGHGRLSFNVVFNRPF